MGELRRFNDRLYPAHVGIWGRPHFDFEFRTGKLPGLERCYQFYRCQHFAIQRDIARRGDAQHAPGHGRWHMAST